MKIRILAVAAATALILTACGGGDSTPPQAKQQNAAANTENAVLNITGAGASFPQPVYVQWAQAFQAATGGKVNYQSIGSSGGVKQISAKTVQFGASDSPLKAEELEKQGLVQFPTVIGGVVPVVNVDGIVAGDLKLTGEVLAGIYLGDIKKWNDPKIKALNPSLVLPDAPITTVFRSDGSGTSFIFTTYLSQVSPKWKDTMGAANTVKWPTSDSGTAGKGNEGVSTYVNRVKNSIGYVEYAYAKQNNMAHVQMQNAAGKFVQPSQESFAAAADVDWKSIPGFSLVLTNQPAEKAWPLAAATFILVHKKADNPAQAKAVLDFFDWSYKNGNEAAAKLDYVPLPDNVKELVRAEWKTITDNQGKAVY
ncbi:phosphate ABC transporter substrate-binding protein PstS [Neisseria dentiae]|uniref:phosphate ABC transporter substrate-binding protein PstS n=1 Tax=Neisseria dentiae TaxID=194197 RepID=UPI00211C42D4|nr:phosphate ABC transporter substrate-binding protein PstS [Neisseria dentiae]MCQ9326953.1 phosphate ABC transporter substrate-binding protein PstS [Neisseria dentiae]